MPRSISKRINKTKKGKFKKNKKIKKHKKYTRKYKNTKQEKVYNKLKGGKFIEKGTSGCVYKPPLLCVGQTETNPDYVSKVMFKKNATSEYEEYSIINEIDPEYIFHMEEPKLCNEIANVEANNEELSSCKLERDFTIEELSMLEYKYGGLDINNFIQQYKEYSADKSIQDCETDLVSLFLDMENLFIGLVKMNEHQFSHLDIKTKNILVKNDDGKYKFNFIDFGISKPYDLVKKRFLGGTAGYFAWPLEIMFLSRQMIYIVKGNQMKQIERIIKQMYVASMRDIMKKIEGYNIYKDFYNHFASYREIMASKTTRENMYDELVSKIDIFSFGIVLVELWSGILQQNLTMETYTSTTSETNPALYQTIEMIRRLIIDMTRSAFFERKSANECYAIYRAIKDYALSNL